MKLLNLDFMCLRIIRFKYLKGKKKLSYMKNANKTEIENLYYICTKVKFDYLCIQKWLNAIYHPVQST